MTMQQENINYAAAHVKAVYEKQHPERHVLRIFTDRIAARMFSVAVSGRLVELNNGFFVVTN